MSLAPQEFAAFVGIDWADATHDVCLQAAGSEKRQRFILQHTPEAIDTWVQTLRTRFQGQPIAMCLELNKGPLVAALQKYDVLGLFPLNPLTLSRSREAFTPSRAKAAPTDAALRLALLLTHRDKLKPLKPPSPEMRALAPLVEQRRRLGSDRVRMTNRLTRALHNYFPHPLKWFDDKGTCLFYDFLSQWPTLKAVPQARRTTLERFCRQHHVRYAHSIEERIEAIKAAQPLTTDEGIIAPPSVVLVQALLGQLRATLHAIEDFDDAMAKRAQSHPDFPLFDALPGAGPVLAPRLLVAFGEQRERYALAGEWQT